MMNEVVFLNERKVKPKEFESVWMEIIFSTWKTVLATIWQEIKATSIASTKPL